MAPKRELHSSRPPSRSRFQEGSMNDRTSAAPPVHFLDPSQLQQLEQPLGFDVNTMTTQPMATSSIFNPDQSDDRFTRENNNVNTNPGMTTRGVKTGKIEKKVVQKKSSRFLGQMWDGVSKRLGLRRGDDAEDKENSLSQQKSRDVTSEKDEILASYHDLVASGFFTSHAIQSTRHAPPPGIAVSRPATSGRSDSASGALSPPPPVWALPTTRGAQNLGMETPPVQRSPNTASSSATSSATRGTKRQLDEERPSLDVRSSMDIRDCPNTNPSKSSASPKKLRKLRSTNSSRFLSLKPSSSSLKLQKQPPHATAAANSSHPPISFPGYIPERGSSARRTVSFGSSDRVLRSRGGVGANSSGAGSFRSRRGGRASNNQMQGIDAVLKVVPNANRGIPDVPVVPDKFTFGEDRENGAPWRGLRIRRGD